MCKTQGGEEVKREEAGEAAVQQKVNDVNGAG